MSRFLGGAAVGPYLDSRELDLAKRGFLQCPFFSGNVRPIGCACDGRIVRDPPPVPTTAERFAATDNAARARWSAPGPQRHELCDHCQIDNGRIAMVDPETGDAYDPRTIDLDVIDLQGEPLTPSTVAAWAAEILKYR